MKNFVLIIALLCGPAGTLLAGADPAFAKANQAYSEGRFQEAVDGYQSLVQAGRSSANLFYDLGNAWFRLGNFGEAILNYERALALEPRHPESEANLQLARDEARALELRETAVEKYSEAGTPTQYSIAASVAFWFAMFATARLFFARRRSAGPIALIVLSLLVFAGASFALYTQENGSKGSALGIVTGKEIQARLATADSAGAVLALPPAAKSSS